MKILCVFGENQYGDPLRGRGTEYTAFVPALKRLGHQVVHFESWDRSCYTDFLDLNRRLLELVDREHPDIMLTVQTDIEIWLETLWAISSRGTVATVSWATDDSWKYAQQSRFIGRYYHAMATTDQAAVRKYQQDGIFNVFPTQWAAASDYFRSPLPASQCRYAVSFVGAAHGDRKARVERLRKRGVQVSCFGAGWPSGPVPAEAIPEIMRQSIICLNFANARGRNQIKARTFEVPGAGGFLLTEHDEALSRYYDVDREIVTFRDEGDMFQKIQYYLTNGDLRDTIALAGFKRTCRDHTYEERLSELITFTVSAQSRWLLRPPCTSLPGFAEWAELHVRTDFLLFLRRLLVTTSRFIWGCKRAPRAARRLIFEFSWRFTGWRTFSARGLTGRLFPEL